MEIPLTDKFIFLNPSYICIYRSDKDMTSALNALRNREISANKAAKLYKIPSSVSLKRPIIVRVIYMSLLFTSCDFPILNFSDIV